MPWKLYAFVSSAAVIVNSGLPPLLTVTVPALTAPRGTLQTKRTTSAPNGVIEEFARARRIDRGLALRQAKLHRPVAQVEVRHRT